MKPAAAVTPKTTSPRILRPRNTPSNVKLLMLSPNGDGGDNDEDASGGMKRKRGSIESAVASKMLRSGSKAAATAAAVKDRQTGIARKSAGATPARLGRK